MGLDVVLHFGLFSFFQPYLSTHLHIYRYTCCNISSGAFVAMAAMSYLDKLIEPMGLTFTIAPFGAVCAVLFAAPNTPAAKV
jgi:CBS-domain-containing membrane protein